MPRAYAGIGPDNAEREAALFYPDLDMRSHVWNDMPMTDTRNDMLFHLMGAGRPESPYTHSRARVLRAYRELRRAGATPTHAMELINTRIYRELSQVGMTQHYIAMREWDLAHARRYLGIIIQRGW